MERAERRILDRRRFADQPDVVEMQKGNQPDRDRATDPQQVLPRDVPETVRTLEGHGDEKCGHQRQRREAVGARRAEHRERNRREIQAVEDAEQRQRPGQPPMPVGLRDERDSSEREIAQQPPERGRQAQQRRPSAGQHHVAAASGAA